jgi:hypothetical protein
MSETLRDTMNLADPNRLDRAAADTRLGDLMTLLIADLAPTESGVTIISDVATLSDQPTASGPFQVVGIGGVGEVKKLLRGSLNADGDIVPVPNPGEVTWDGNKGLRFNTDDAETTCDVTYALADGSDKASILLRSLGEQDG